MLRLIVRRLLLAVLTIWGVATAVFFMIKAIPGDEARIAAGRTATPEQIEQARERLGLDHSVVVQYGEYLQRLLHGDLGTSVVTFQPISSDLATVLPPTLELVALTMVINVLIAVPLGVFSALRLGRSGDTASRLIMVLGGGVPVFWLALMLQYLIGSRLGWLPISGRNDYGLESPHVTGLATVDALLAGNVAGFTDAIRHLVLPALALSAPFLAVVARAIRSSMVGALKADHVAFARAKGASNRRIIWRHALPNALVPTLTLLGMQFGWMMGAALLVEAVFSIPGVGTYLNSAVTSQDTYAVLGAVLVLGLVFILANLLVDLVQFWLDPRTRVAS
ncbi:ABC transporter permease [Paractinoplanes toevensis]|uniref:Peptide ABC transporter permease n=1 Tax=Paractinoplanes toevensis TaxID=571911 RepID=A0A919W0R3_9ACTN|nr:ABC transporter permease [Actinoplanes toevensis]GIM91592.1 peptide ABC transporter permease [Actinoplanes toevensis]